MSRKKEQGSGSHAWALLGAKGGRPSTIRQMLGTGGPAAAPHSRQKRDCLTEGKRSFA